MVKWRARVGRLALGLALSVGSLAAPLRAQGPETIFEEGNKAYDEGRFEEAREAYLTLLRYRIRDARVEFNLGNTEFKLGRLGYAVLHFERARRMSPTDDEILANLAYARSFSADQVEPRPFPAPLRWLFALQDRLGPDTHAWAGLAQLWLVFGLLAWGLARPGRWSGALGWSLAGLLLALTVTGGSWHLTWQRLEGTRLAVVVSEAAEVLAGPGRNNATLATVHEGLTLRVREVRPDWMQVTLPNELYGWLLRDSVEEV